MLPRRDVRAYDVDNDSVNKSNLQSGDFIGKHYIYIYIYIYVEKNCCENEISFHLRMVCAELLFTG